MRNVFYLLISVIILNGCTKNTDFIPEVFVNFRIPASEVGGVGQAIYTNNTYGVKGIIIYHQNTNEYTAFDRACSYQPSSECALVEISDLLSPTHLIDSCCNSMFFLDDGTPFNGPALLPLKQYQTSFDGIYIRVHN